MHRMSSQQTVPGRGDSICPSREAGHSIVAGGWGGGVEMQSDVTGASDSQF